MALTTKRIIALPSQTDPQEGDYFAIDNAQGGTKKIAVGRIGVEVDDTLTEQGKAADAKAVGDALDEIRSQVEVTGTASGAIATFADGSDAPMKSCIATIVPKQSGSGTPSPDNVRPISGWESVNVYVSPTEDEADGHTTNVNLGRTVYGGEAEIVSGSLTDKTAMVDLGTLNWTKSGTRFYKEFSASSPERPYAQPESFAYVTDALCSQYTATSRANIESVTSGFSIHASGGSIYVTVHDEQYDNVDTAAFKTAMSGVQLVYELATPQTYTLTGQEISTLLGENNVWADSGDVEVVYVRDLNITINNLLNSNGTRSLGMMAMSAPTEATAEEPTGEQSDEQGDEDMR